ISVDATSRLSLSGTVQGQNPLGQPCLPSTIRLTRTASTPTAPATKLLPQFVFGGGWSSALYFSNTSNQPTTVQVQFSGNDGKPVVVPSLGFSPSTLNLPPRGLTIVEALNTGPLMQGYASVSVPETVVGYGIFRQSVAGQADQEAVVPFSGGS